MARTADCSPARHVFLSTRFARGYHRSHSHGPARDRSERRADRGSRAIRPPHPQCSLSAQISPATPTHPPWTRSHLPWPCRAHLRQALHSRLKFSTIQFLRYISVPSCLSLSPPPHGLVRVPARHPAVRAPAYPPARREFAAASMRACSISVRVVCDPHALGARLPPSVENVARGPDHRVAAQRIPGPFDVGQ